MKFRRPELKDIDEAVELALVEYKNECSNNKELLKKNYKEKLKEINCWELFNNIEIS